MSNTDSGSAANLTGNMITDHDADDGGAYIVGFEFACVLATGAKMSFFIDPTTTEPAEWLALAEAIKANKPFQISTCMSNGDVSVEHANGEVVFRTHKAGAGGDGDLKVTLPASQCLAALEKCAKAFADHASESL
jgi:hypothetical protein